MKTRGEEGNRREWRRKKKRSGQKEKMKPEEGLSQRRMKLDKDKKEKKEGVVKNSTSILNTVK